jgi:hypothetical protein
MGEKARELAIGGGKMYGLGTQKVSNGYAIW